MNIGQSNDSASSLPSSTTSPASGDLPIATTQDQLPLAESNVIVASGKDPAPEVSAATGTTTAGPLAAVVRGVGAGPLAARGLGIAKPGSPQSAKPSSAKPVSSTTKADARQLSANQPATAAEAGATETAGNRATVPPGRDAIKKQEHKRPRLAGENSAQADAAAKSIQIERQSKVAVPNLRQRLSDDLLAEMELELAGADVAGFLGGNAGMANRKAALEEGQRVHGTILKIHDDSVFVALGGPDEGVVPFLNFTGTEPKPGDAVEVIVRGISRADGLYALTLPGEAVDVSDWEDIEEGVIVEVTVSGSNAGGLECKVGGIDGFIPISQISEHRIEDTSEYIGQKLICIVTESNPRRGNLVLSRRGVLERERSEKKKEQLEKIEAGDLLEGVVRTIKDFGAFIDLGGLEGLIHISKMSWDRIKHPSEVFEVGQKVKVKIDKVDKQTGKIGLSYRDTLENPWDAIAATVAVGAVMTGAVTRIANFGAFVRLAAGVEGLVHISEVASHRISNVEAFVKEGQDVEVKVLSIDVETQKISLSMKQVHNKPAEAIDSKVEEVDEPVREPLIKAKHTGPLRGGNDRPAGGEKFGLRW